MLETGSTCLERHVSAVLENDADHVLFLNHQIY
jgi:hypothetical protein